MLHKNKDKECTDQTVIDSYIQDTKITAEKYNNERELRYFTELGTLYKTKGLTFRQQLIFAHSALGEEYSKSPKPLGRFLNGLSLFSSLANIFHMELEKNDYFHLIPIVDVETKRNLYDAAFWAEMRNEQNAPYHTELAEAKETAVNFDNWKVLRRNWSNKDIEEAIYGICQNTEAEASFWAGLANNAYHYKTGEYLLKRWIANTDVQNPALEAIVERISALEKVFSQHYQIKSLIKDHHIYQFLLEKMQFSENKEILKKVIYLRGFVNLEKDVQKKIVKDKELLIKALEHPLLLEVQSQSNNAIIDIQSPTKAYRLAGKKMITDYDVIRKAVRVVRYKSLKEDTKKILEKKPELADEYYKSPWEDEMDIIPHSAMWLFYNEYLKNVDVAYPHTYLDFYHTSVNTELIRRIYSEERRAKTIMLIKYFDLVLKCCINFKGITSSEICFEAIKAFTENVSVKKTCGIFRVLQTMCDTEGIPLELWGTGLIIGSENLNCENESLGSYWRFYEYINKYLVAGGEKSILVKILKNYPSLAYKFKKHLTKKDFNDIVCGTNNLAF